MSLSLQLWFALGIILIVVVAVALSRLKFQLGPRFQYRKKESPMTPSERSCYNALIASLGAEYRVFPQLHLDCLLEPTAYGRDKLYAFRHINQKSVDFVLCDKQLRSILAIELDDRTHERPDRVQRDALLSTILKDAGIPLLRIHVRDGFDPQSLATRVRNALAPTSPRSPEESRVAS